MHDQKNCWLRSNFTCSTSEANKDTTGLAKIEKPEQRDDNAGFPLIGKTQGWLISNVQ